MSVISSDDICMIPQRSKKVNTLSKFFLIIERKEVTGNDCFNHKIDKKSILNRMELEHVDFFSVESPADWPLRQTDRRGGFFHRVYAAESGYKSPGIPFSALHAPYQEGACRLRLK